MSNKFGFISLQNRKDTLPSSVTINVLIRVGEYDFKLVCSVCVSASIKNQKRNI